MYSVSVQQSIGHTYNLYISGHVYNRKNCVVYSPTGHGTPRQFYTEAEQSPQKVMVFCAIHGSGKLFGPVFFEGNFRLNQHRYREMLEHTIFPQMQEELGEEWSSVIFQQDGARAHTANMVVNWLDTLFGDRVLSSRCV